MRHFIRATALALGIVVATATAALACTIASVTAVSSCDSVGVVSVTATAHGVGSGDEVAFSNSVTADVQHDTSLTYLFIVPYGTPSVTVSAYATNGEARSKNTATVTITPATCPMQFPTATLKYIRCSDPEYLVTLNNSQSNVPVTFVTRYRRLRDLGIFKVSKTVAGGATATFTTPPLHKGSYLKVYAVGHRLAYVPIVSKDHC